MSPKAVAIALCLLVVTVLLTVNCSGPGVAVATIQQVGLKTLAADHVSAVLLLRGWLKIMYVKNIPGAGQCQQQINQRSLPGGGRRVWGTNSDCSQFDYTIRADGSGEGLLTGADGGAEELTWTAPVWNGLVHTVSIDKTMPDGTRLNFTNTADFGQAGTPTSMIGQVTLPDGRIVDFALQRHTQVRDWLRLEMPDSAVLEATIPTTSVQYAVHWPVFDPGATGFLADAAGQRMDFAISGAADQWTRWIMDAPDGTRGEFNLGPDLSGNGNLTRNGAVVGALRWPQDGFGTLDLVGAGSAEVTPSAAARDFQIDRWVANMAAMGPAPMY